MKPYKLHSKISPISVGARASKLSLKQVEEVNYAIRYHHPDLKFATLACQTTGDLDQKTSLRDLGKTDFFTREIDKWLLQEKCRIAIHSAKDLPDPLHEELEVIAITQPMNSEDVIVFHPEQNVLNLPERLTIATSSLNREKNALKQYPHAEIVDLRGAIEKRIQRVLNREVDGAILAKVALMRLGLQDLNMVSLKGSTTPLQGSLAIVARKEDSLMKKIFSSIDSRVKEKSLYFGLSSNRYYSRGEVVHLPLIEIEPCPKKDFLYIGNEIQRATHLIITSQTSVRILCDILDFYQVPKELLKSKKIIAIGQSTSQALQDRGLYSSYIANDESQEGIIKLLGLIRLRECDCILYPKSTEARPLLQEYLESQRIALKVLNLYKPKSICLKEKPELSDFNEIVFTSPSTVKAFYENYNAIPSHLRIVCKGAVTEDALKKYQVHI